MSLSETERADLAAEMREWTAESVERSIFGGAAVKGYDGGDSRRIALAELLRRERERCAKESEDGIAEAEESSDTAPVVSWLRDAAARIRGLQ